MANHLELPRVDPETIATPEAARERIKALREAAKKSNMDQAMALQSELIQVENRLAYLTAIEFVVVDDGSAAVLYGVSDEVMVYAQNGLYIGSIFFDDSQYNCFGVYCNFESDRIGARLVGEIKEVWLDVSLGRNNWRVYNIRRFARSEEAEAIARVEERNRLHATRAAGR